MKLITLFCVFLVVFENSIAQTPGLWTWMGGDSTYGNTIETLNSFGAKGVFDDSNVIPKLYGCSGWQKGNSFYVFGGSYDPGDGQTKYTMNSLWEYRMDLGQWAWIGGDDTVSKHAPVYGTLGVPAPDNFPGARTNAATWVDLDGNLWLFGGATFGVDELQKNDLWKYDFNTGWWTWVHGPSESEDFGWYGIKGVADPINVPPAKCRAESWTDKEGNLWLFGGVSFWDYWGNDLWKYNIPTNKWTWMNGSHIENEAGVYGTLGVPDAENTPGSRQVNRLHWMDTIGNFYLFGGYTYYPSAGNFHDLWKYEVASNNWIWIGGTPVQSYAGIYTQPCDSVNDPASRMEATGWIDKDGKFWLFGGRTNLTNPGLKAGTTDLWKYDPYQNKWTWFSGDNFSYNAGTYGDLGIESPLNLPQSRWGALSFTDTSGSLWMWGGTISTVLWEDVTLNDLWRFVPDSSCIVFTGENQFFDLNMNGFTLYPSPASEQITLSFNHALISHVVLSDILGQKKFSVFGLEEDQISVDIHAWPPGIYMAAIYLKDRTRKSIKFIKE